MKTGSLLFLLFICSFRSNAQHNEFEMHSNGLIYSDTTVSQLRYIVDSLNLKFRMCDLSRTYLSVFQARAHFIYLKNGDSGNARKDMENNISYDEFIKKYKDAERDEELPVIRQRYLDYSDEEKIEFASLGFNSKYHHEITYSYDAQKHEKALKGKWIYSLSSYSNSLSAFYFTDEFRQQPIPVKYARMIQYSDCLVDTSAMVFLKNAGESGGWAYKEAPDAVEKFWEYLRKFDKKNPEYGSREYWVWDSLRMLTHDSLQKADPRFMSLLNKAVDEAMKKGGYEDGLEKYAGRYISRKKELELKRNRRVIGGCSMDSRPRVHALNIAILSAETVNWEIFLRSHLDIMNDRFDRVSDGNYAWARRNTYIRELEVLDINVADLLLGISLRIENPSNNHYYGTIHRVGRALAETVNPGIYENAMLEMMADSTLDDYNRVLMYYLFINYNSYLSDKTRQDENKKKLSKAVMLMPGYISSKISVE